MNRDTQKGSWRNEEVEKEMWNKEGVSALCTHLRLDVPRKYLKQRNKEELKTFAYKQMATIVSRGNALTKRLLSVEEFGSLELLLETINVYHEALTGYSIEEDDRPFFDELHCVETYIKRQLISEQQNQLVA